MKKTRAVPTWGYRSVMKRRGLEGREYRHTWVGHYPGLETVWDEITDKELRPAKFILRIQSWQETENPESLGQHFNLITQARHPSARRYSTHRSLAGAMAHGDRWARRRFYYKHETEIARVRTIMANGDPQFDDEGNERVEMVTCGHCGQEWNDARTSQLTPTPAGRCPFEYAHQHDDDN